MSNRRETERQTDRQRKTQKGVKRNISKRRIRVEGVVGVGVGNYLFFFLRFDDRENKSNFHLGNKDGIQTVICMTAGSS